MEVQDLKNKISQLSVWKVAGSKSYYLKGYESIFLNYGLMCEFIFNNFDEFDKVDIEMFASLGDAISVVNKKLRFNEPVSSREIDVLNVLMGQYSDMLSSLYGFVSPLNEETRKADLKEEIDAKLRGLKSELDFLDFLYSLYRPKEIHSPEGVSTIEVCDEVIRSIKQYIKAIEVKKNELSSGELASILEGLNRAEDLIVRIRVVIAPVGVNTKEKALAGLQDFLVRANEIRQMK